MIFILIALLLFLGIAFFQTIQGAFSALIMLVLTILSAAVAVNFYAPLSRAFLLDKIYDYADTAALTVLFAATLVILRTIADNFIRGNIVIWEWPDRVLAGVLSLPTALILVGMGCLAFQMLPFDDQVLWFNHFAVDDNTKVEARSGLFPYGDEFAGWLMGTLSQGSLRNETPMDLVHPDWAGEASAQRIAIQKESKHTVPSGAISLASEGAWRGKEKLLVKEFSGGPGSSGKDTVTTSERDVRDDRHYYLVVRLELGPQAMDGDGYYRFGWGQFRLVGFPTAVDRKHTMNVYAIGARDPSQGAKMYCLRVKVPYQSGTDSYDQAVWEKRNYGLITKSGKIDVVFEVPNDFVPWFVEYKRWARTMVSKVSDKDPTAFEAVAAAPAQDVKDVGHVAQAGFHNQFQADAQRTAFTNELPFKLMSGAARGAGGGGETEISGGKFVRGRVVGTLGGTGGLDSGPGAPVTEFEVSSDKRLLRVECNFVVAGNPLIQNVFGMVSSVAAQQKAIDSQGNPYLPIGKYVILNMQDGTQQVEMIFHGTDAEGEASAGRDQFQTVSRGQLQASGGKVGFLYVVPPGTKMKTFEPGRPFESQTLEMTAPR